MASNINQLYINLILNQDQFYKINPLRSILVIGKSNIPLIT